MVTMIFRVVARVLISGSYGFVGGCSAILVDCYVEMVQIFQEKEEYYGEKMGGKSCTLTVI